MFIIIIVAQCVLFTHSRVYTRIEPVVSLCTVVLRTQSCEKCGAGEDFALYDECAERCCMPKGTKNRMHDTDYWMSLRSR